MNWKLIFLLSLFGILMGFVSAFGFTGKLEWLFWLIIAVICAVIISKNQRTKNFLHGLLTGFLDGIFNGIILSIFFTAYLSNNPESLEGFRQSPINPRVFILLSGPIIGIIFGCVIGLFATISNKIGVNPKQNEVEQTNTQEE